MHETMSFGLNPRSRSLVGIVRRRPALPVSIFTNLTVALMLVSCCFVVAEEPIHDPATTTSATPTDKSKYPSASRQEVTNRIETLIGQLDSLNYQARETAANELAQIGGLAIAPLARQSLECSPEQSWRIKKTLEKICTSGNEEDFF